MVDVLFERAGADARATRVIGFDQRGTGASGLLRCKELERDGRLRSTVAASSCAAAGSVPQRAFYTTPDSVEDMEAIRQAVGARKLTLFGISYGTELALAYARAYPARVDRLILDSVVDPDENDPFGLAGFRAMGPSLASLCPDRCRGLSADPGARTWRRSSRSCGRAAARRLVRRARAPPHAARVRPIAIADLLYDADYNPALRAGRADGGARGARQRRRGADAAAAGRLRRLLAARRTRATSRPPATRPSARRRRCRGRAARRWPTASRSPATARSRSRAAAFVPFDAEVAYADEIDLCLRWPDPGQPPRALGGAYPAVPTLILQGQEDLRTPPEVSAHVATLIAGHAARDGAGRRPRDRRRRSERLRPAPAAAVRGGRRGALAMPARADRRARDGRAAGLVRRAGAGGRALRARGEDRERGRRDARLPRLRPLSRR